MQDGVTWILENFTPKLDDAQISFLILQDSLEREGFRLFGIPKLDLPHRPKLRVTTCPYDPLFL